MSTNLFCANGGDGMVDAFGDATGRIYKDLALAFYFLTCSKANTAINEQTANTPIIIAITTPKDKPLCN